VIAGLRQFLVPLFPKTQNQRSYIPTEEDLVVRVSGYGPGREAGEQVDLRGVEVRLESAVMGEVRERRRVVGRP
jgi:hypothetical protein